MSLDRNIRAPLYMKHLQLILTRYVNFERLQLFKDSNHSLAIFGPMESSPL